MSSKIAHLERAFQIQLLVRLQAKGISLTPAGQRIVVEARSLLAHASDFAEGSQALAGSLSGPLEVGCFVTFARFYLPRLLLSFAGAQPGVRVSVQEGALDVLQDRLISGACELALLYDLGIGDTVGSLVLTRLVPYALLARNHPLAERKALSLKDLSQEPLVLLDLPHSRDYFRAIFLRSGIDPRITHRSLSSEMVRGLVANAPRVDAKGRGLRRALPRVFLARPRKIHCRVRATVHRDGFKGQLNAEFIPRADRVGCRPRQI